MGAAAVALCPTCKREILPQLVESSWHHDAHRGAATFQKSEPESTAGAKARRRKERKDGRARQQAQIRKQVRVHGMIAAAKFFLSLKASEASRRIHQIMDDDCPRCLKIQSRATG
jgi:hypothetical protein